MYSILIYSPSRTIRRSLKELLEYEKYNVLTASNRDEANELIGSMTISLVLYHIDKMSEDGQLPEEIYEYVNDSYPIAFIVENCNKTAEIELTKISSSEVIDKPVNIPILLSVVRRLLTENEVCDKSSDDRCDKESPLSLIIGDSDEINEVKKMIRVVAETDARVLITGESGTGKELVAQCIHKLSSRYNNRMIEVNCAAIPDELIESELFGHEKGSFTSAIKQRKGKFEQASGGTLFLDEIGDMSLSAQAKVLRTLQEKTITRVGGDVDIHIDTRVITATNKDLKEEVKNGYFREDLYHRLCVVEIMLPSLNKRVSDIPDLVNFFIKDMCKSYDKSIKSIDHTAIELLQTRVWSGNIRELRNVVEKLVIFSDDVITCELVKKYVMK